ncbi:MAG: hypothetical protein RI895_55 [Actinomycetota bacterium]|jgi:uncharacterized protein YbjQ (UPF0145 family)
MANPDPGWYSDPSDVSYLRYWDGSQWTEQIKGDPSAEKLFIVTSQEVAGKQISEVLGVVIGTGTVMMRVTNSSMTRDSFVKARADLSRNAAGMGADGVVALTISSETNNNNSNTVFLCGTAVKFAD